MSESRRFQRIGFDAPVTISGDNGTWDGEVLDISLHGALVMLPDGWPGRLAAPYHLEIRLENGVQITMQVSLAHWDGARAGFRCEASDVESMSHLRRLIELNLGDPTLLEREFSALMGDESTGQS